jgi:membrane protein
MSDEVDAPTGTTHGLAARQRARLRQAWLFLYDVADRFINNDGLVVAGYIAFTLLFALFPFLIFLVTVGSVLGQGEAAGEFIELTLDALPNEVAIVLRPAIEEVVAVPRTGLMTLSILMSLWFASSGLESLRHAVNLAFGYEHALPFWLARLLSLTLTVLFSIAIVLVMIVLVVAPLAWDYLARTFDLPESVGWIYELVRYLVGALILLSSTSLLYRLLPNRRLRKREVLPGALTVVVLWMVAVSLFSYYLANFAAYSVTYGSLGGIMVTMMFFYISACIFILGAEINAAVKRRFGAER